MDWKSGRDVHKSVDGVFTVMRRKSEVSIRINRN